MASSETARNIVRDLERVSPYMYEGLYGTFLRQYMDSDKSRWTANLSVYLSNVNEEWRDISAEVAGLLWENFERRISC